MKIRIGFVSNSSTSSYLILTTKKAHEAVIANLSDDKAKVMKTYKHLRQKKVLGVDAVEFSYASGNYGYEIDDLFDMDVLRSVTSGAGDSYDFAYELVNEYMEEVKKHQDTYSYEDDF